MPFSLCRSPDKTDLYSNNQVMSPVDDEYLAIATTEAHGLYEHKLKRADHQPGPKDIVAEVAFSGLNHIDVNQHETGAYVKAFPYVLGKEWSGEVVQVGSEVIDLKVGDQVFFLFFQSVLPYQRLK